MFTVDWLFGPQYTRTNANCDAAFCPGFGTGGGGGGPTTPKAAAAACALFTAKYTLYSRISPCVDGGGSQLKWAPSPLFVILMADGAPGKPGRHVLKETG